VRLVSVLHRTSNATCTVTAINCAQALLPFAIGLYDYPTFRRLPALWFVRQLPSPSEEQQTAHAKLTALCHSEVVPHTITAHQEKQLAASCRNPVIQLSKTAVTFLLRDVFGMGASGSTDKEERIKELVDDPQTADKLAEFIAAGYDVSDMRVMNGKGEEPAFQPFMNIFAEKLEVQSELAAEEGRRVEGMPGQEQAHGTLVRPTPLAPSMRAMLQRCLQHCTRRIMRTMSRCAFARLWHVKTWSNAIINIAAQCSSWHAQCTTCLETVLCAPCPALADDDSHAGTGHQD
jgi:hypothetical protein